ncbi:MAG: hypothetical protein ABFD50_19010 [Smithella sp.]
MKIKILKQLIADDEAEFARLPRTQNGLVTYELAKKEAYLKSSIQAMKRALVECEKEGEE